MTRSLSISQADKRHLTHTMHQYDSEASRPLLEKERPLSGDIGRLARFSRLLQAAPPSVTSDSSGRDSDSFDGFDAFKSGAASVDRKQLRTPRLEDRSSRGFCADCSEWFCWKWIFPERITDYDDFATSAQVRSRASVCI